KYTYFVSLLFQQNKSIDLWQSFFSILNNTRELYFSNFHGVIVDFKYIFCFCVKKKPQLLSYIFKEKQETFEGTTALSNDKIATQLLLSKEEIQIIIQYWIRILQIKMWVKDVNKIVYLFLYLYYLSLLNSNVNV
ncbi:hypothetical protein RFI_29662, partial [Reticulomyxa filosa]